MSKNTHKAFRMITNTYQVVKASIEKMYINKVHTVPNSY